MLEERRRVWLEGWQAWVDRAEEEPARQSPGRPQARWAPCLTGPRTRNRRRFLYYIGSLELARYFRRGNIKQRGAAVGAVETVFGAL